jgi:hypothetical protein
LALLLPGRKNDNKKMPNYYMIANEMDTHSNQMVEDVYVLTSVGYHYNSQQLSFSISTMIITTLNDTKKTPLHDVIA